MDLSLPLTASVNHAALPVAGATRNYGYYRARSRSSLQRNAE